MTPLPPDGLARKPASPRSRPTAIKAATAAVAADRSRVGRAAPATPRATPAAGASTEWVVALARAVMPARPVAGRPAGRTRDDRYSYGLGVILSGDWLPQPPSFYDHAGVMAHLPAGNLAIAAAVTFTEAGFDAQGAYKTHNAARDLVAAIAAALAPDAPVPA